MVTKTEGKHIGEFLVSEANGTRSRQGDLVISSGQGKLASGTVVSKVASELVATTSGNTGTVAGVLWHGEDATSADAKAVYIARDAEVDTSLLIVPDNAKVAALAALVALGIIPR